MLRNKTVFELCDPEPLTVATWILMSLMMRFCSGGRLSAWRDTSVVAIPRPSSSFEQSYSARNYCGAALYSIGQRSRSEHPRTGAEGDKGPSLRTSDYLVMRRLVLPDAGSL